MSTQQKPTPSRPDHFWEIDALRGVAIVMMVTFHFVYDLYAFGLSNTLYEDRFWHYFQRTTASLFIGLVGVSLAVSYARAVARAADRGKTAPGLGRKYLARGARLLGWGLLISTVTYFALGPDAYIQFGILHFIGLSVILAYPFLAGKTLGKPWVILTVGAVLLFLGPKVIGGPVDFPWLLWLGFMPAGYQSVDYFPLIPWFGLVLIGLFLGRTLYVDNHRRLPLPDLSRFLPVKALQWLGQRSLPIYLLHQIVLYALFVVATGGLW